MIMRCERPIHRLRMHRAKNLHGPFPQKTAFSCVKTTGNFLAPGMPGSGPQALFGTVTTATTIQVTFSQCVSISAATGIEYNIDGGVWTQVLGSVKDSDAVWTFTTANIDPGDIVRWRYIGGSGTIVDCADAGDIGDQEIPIDNPLVLAGDFVLLETGGMDIALVEDDIDDTSAILQEIAP